MSRSVHANVLEQRQVRHGKVVLALIAYARSLEAELTRLRAVEQAAAWIADALDAGMNPEHVLFRDRRAALRAAFGEDPLAKMVDEIVSERERLRTALREKGVDE